MDSSELRPLPSIVLVEAVETVRWPLDPSSSPALHFEPLERMVEIRRQEQADTATTSSSNTAESSRSNRSNSVGENIPRPSTSSSAAARQLAQAVLGTVASLQTGTDANMENADGDDTTLPASASQRAKREEMEYKARIATALILLGHGYTDEAHDLVSPLSWPKALEFAHGGPVATTGHVLALASYAHCLVHRREGVHDSEFGQTGFDNSQYWAGAALRSGGEEMLPLTDIRQAITTLASSQQQRARSSSIASTGEEGVGSAATAASSNAAMDWLNSKVFVEDWDPRFLTELCQCIMENRPGYEDLREFAERAAEIELRVLIQHVLQVLGFASTTPPSRRRSM